MDKIFKVGVTLPVSICLEVICETEEEALDIAKNMALHEPWNEWDDDFSKATATILED